MALRSGINHGCSCLSTTFTASLLLQTGLNQRIIDEALAEENISDYPDIKLFDRHSRCFCTVTGMTR